MTTNNTDDYQLENKIAKAIVIKETIGELQLYYEGDLIGHIQRLIHLGISWVLIKRWTGITPGRYKRMRKKLEKTLLKRLAEREAYSAFMRPANGPSWPVID